MERKRKGSNLIAGGLSLLILLFGGSFIIGLGARLGDLLIQQWMAP